MKIPMKAFRFLLIITILGALGACSSSRRAAAPAEKAQADTVWHTLYAPVKVNVTSPMSLGASGRATLVRDSLLHLSLRFFGMEVAQIRADRDSAWIVDKYHKIYTSMPLARLTAASGLTLANVQDILLGRAFLPDLLPAVSERVSFEALGFTTSPAGQVASEVSFSAKAGKRQVSGSLRWDFGKARWNTPVDTRWAAPAGYRQIQPDELLESLKSL